MSPSLNYFGHLLLLFVHKICSFCWHLSVTDMCLDSSVVTSELHAASLHTIDPSRHDVKVERYQAVCHGRHACLELAGTDL